MPERPGTRCRSGFALVAVLWVVVAAGALALVARLAARDLVASTRNRVDSSRARWSAEGCAAAARAAIDRALWHAREDGPTSPTWSELDRVLGGSLLVRDCDLQLVASGRLDVNNAAPEALVRLFRQAGAAEAQADSLLDAVLDWRDADETPRPLGAEAESYRRTGAPGPRNGDFADVREVLRVRGMRALSGIDTLLSVEGGRISLNHAPRAVLAALPGLGPEAGAILIDMRERREPIQDLGALDGRLSPGARAEMLRHYPALARATTLQPDNWLLLSRSAEGTPPVTAVLELRLVRAGSRAAVVRTRSWME